MARRYTRDNRGRFAPAGRGATARGARLRTANGRRRPTVTTRAKARPANTIGKARSPRPVALQRRPIANGIRRTAAQPLVRRANNVRPYRPATFDGKFAQIDRQMDRAIKPLADAAKAISKQEIDKMSRWLERTNARSIADRHRKDIEGEIARAELSTVGSKPGQKAIRRRMQRALSAAARGSAAGQRAIRVYLDQLAGMGPGRPAKGRNNIKPGPRNTKGPPKRKRGNNRKRG